MTERKAYSVSQITSYISNMFAQDYLLGHVYVRGELSNVKYHSSGMLFFTLKDEASAIACMMFAANVKKLKMRFKDGQQVIAMGSIRVFERDGKYQLYAVDIRDDGAGRLSEQFEALKRELLEMGMFDEAYKQPIPKYIRRLGVVTTPTGAAVQDIIHISRRRYPGIQIVLYPAKVQGEGAAESIIRGIEQLDRTGVDVIIVGRGGGSMEDLWAFNEETVARAIFACRTPVISAVGHETDTVISDYVADLRAPTPSAAAELAVADVRQTLMQIGQYSSKLLAGMEAVLQAKRARVKEYAMQMALLSPKGHLKEQRHRLDIIRSALAAGMKAKVAEKRAGAQLISSRLEALSPYHVLEAGYAFVSDEKGERIWSVDQFQEKDTLTVRFTDGSAKVEVLWKKKKTKD